MSSSSEEMRLEQKAGKRLAVAVEGDAGIYASVHYVLDLLEENGIPVEQLPGIPSFIAAEAAAKLHLISQKEILFFSVPPDGKNDILRTNWTCI